ncbi:xanthine dehydrogenase family protein [Paracoccus versutus]|uniref:xanthine dehydrogenase family protein n=1 Tax=Paracoccus versutus TaxID=34007 RepID=UPI000E271FD4|nr:xanthine dehydrogenase family protein [Paracoccus versutus]WGR54649.1 hypothetical protein E3U25_00640 [Paracoccus versutus]
MNEITARRPQGDRRTRTGDRPLRPDRVQAVTGAARYGRDNAPHGVLTGKVLRPVPAHAHIRRIVTSAAEDLNGVDAVVTGADGASQPWGPNRGRFRMRDLTAKMSGMSPGDIRATPAQIGGGFGGKSKVYLGPVAMPLSRKAGLPVTMMMSREKVFRATSPDSDPRVRVQIGPRRDGTLTAAEIKLCDDTGAFPGAPFIDGVPCAFSQDAFSNPHGTGYHLVSNRATTAAHRAPDAMPSCFAAEEASGVLAKRIGMDPLELRLKNAIRVGDTQIGDRQTAHEGCAEIVEALRAHPTDTRRLGPNQRRGVTTGIWHNGSGHFGATCLPRRDDSWTSMATMAASTCGMPYERDQTEIRDIAYVRFGDVTGGSRVTSATGKAIHVACTPCFFVESRRIQSAHTGRAGATGGCDRRPFEHLLWRNHVRPCSRSVRHDVQCSGQSGHRRCRIPRFRHGAKCGQSLRRGRRAAKRLLAGLPAAGRSGFADGRDRHRGGAEPPITPSGSVAWPRRA